MLVYTLNEWETKNARKKRWNIDLQYEGNMRYEWVSGVSVSLCIESQCLWPYTNSGLLTAQRIWCHSIYISFGCVRHFNLLKFTKFMRTTKSFFICFGSMSIECHERVASHFFFKSLQFDAFFGIKRHIVNTNGNLFIIFSS